MNEVTLYVEKSEPYCLFLSFVDMEEFLVFKNLCQVKTVVGNENNSMLCVSNISTTLKQKLKYATTFQVSAEKLAKLSWQTSAIEGVRYELNGQKERFESILPTKNEV